METDFALQKKLVRSMISVYEENAPGTDMDTEFNFQFMLALVACVHTFVFSRLRDEVHDQILEEISEFILDKSGAKEMERIYEN